MKDFLPPRSIVMAKKGAKPGSLQATPQAGAAPEESAPTPEPMQLEGNPRAALLLLGSHLASQEPAGELLDKMLAAIGLDRAQVCIAPIELGASVLQQATPQIIITLGAHPDFNAPRGQLVRQGSIKVLVSHHPKDLLKNAELKREAWGDLQLVAKELGIALPRKK